MVWNDVLKREIPEGWRALSLSDLLHENKRPFNSNKIVQNIDLSVMPEANISLSKVNSSDNFSTNLYSMKTGDILMGSIRPYLKKAGIAPVNGSHAGTVLNFSPNQRTHYNFVLFTLCSDNFFSYAIKRSRGTKMPIISSADVLDYCVPFNESVVELFGSINVSELITKNIEQSLKLANLRNYLFPLLMSQRIVLTD